MQDKFESNMGEKLEELNFVPPGKVWDNIERELKKDKRPRIAAWWWMLPLAVLLGWGTYRLLVADHQQKPEVTKNSPGNNKAENSSQLKVAPERNTIIVQNQESPAAELQVPAAVNAVAPKNIISKNHSGGNTKKQFTLNQLLNKQGEKTEPSYKKQQTFKDNARSSITVDAAALSDEQEIKEITPATETTVQETETGRPDDKLPPVAKAAKVKKETQDIPKPDVQSKEASNKTGIHKWQIGLQANAGIASINKAASFNENEPSVFYGNTNNPGTVTPGRIVSNSYQINNGESFSGGLVALKAVSPKLQLGSGLLYNHTRISVTRIQKTDSISASGTGVVLNTTRIDNHHESLRLHSFDIPLSAGFTALNTKKIQLDINVSVINRFILSGNWEDYEIVLGKKKSYISSFQLNPVLRFARWPQFSLGPYAAFGLSKMQDNKRLMNAGLSLQYLIKK